MSETVAFCSSYLTILYNSINHRARKLPILFICACINRKSQICSVGLQIILLGSSQRPSNRNPVITSIITCHHCLSGVGGSLERRLQLPHPHFYQLSSFLLLLFSAFMTLVGWLYPLYRSSLTFFFFFSNKPALFQVCCMM